MEFADGGDLWAKLQASAPTLLPEVLVLHYFVQLCLALHHLHSQRVLHRDLKSANVFLTSDNVVKLGDFGISTVLQHTMSMAHTKCGTPYYFSPEICKGRPYSYASDVWALGCILYELCALRHAFTGRSMTDLLQQITSGSSEPLSRPYSSDLCHLVEAMLTKDPAQRPTVEELLRLNFLHGTVRQVIDGGATDPYGQSEERTTQRNRKRYLKESERLLHAHDTQQAVQAYLLLREDHEKTRGAVERREVEEAVQRIQREMRRLQSPQQRTDAPAGSQDSEGEMEDAPEGSPTSSSPIKASPTQSAAQLTAGPASPPPPPARPPPPPGSRASKAALGEQVMDLMLREQRRQELVAQGLDPAEVERVEEERRRRDMAAQAEAQRRLKEAAARQKAEQDKEQFAQMLAKRKALQKAARVLQDRGLFGSDDDEADFLPSPVPRLSPKETAAEVAAQQKRAEAARRAQVQAALDRQRAKLLEMERRLALEQRARDEVRHQEEALKAQWKSRGWNLDLLEEQLQQRQLERIRARYEERQADLEAILGPSNPPPVPASSSRPTGQQEPPLLLDAQATHLATVKGNTFEDLPPPLFDSEAVPSPVESHGSIPKAEQPPSRTPQAEVLQDCPKARQLLRAEEEARKRLEALLQQEARALRVQVRKHLGDVTSRVQVQSRAHEAGVRRAERQVHRQRQLEEQARQRGERFEDHRQRVLEAHAKIQQQREEEAREWHAEEELRRQRALVWALEKQRERPAASAGPLPPLEGMPAEGAAQLVVCGDAAEEQDAYVMVRRGTQSDSSVISWVDEVDDAEPNLGPEPKKDAVVEDSPPRPAHTRAPVPGKLLKPKFCYQGIGQPPLSAPLGDMTGVITVISANKPPAITVDLPEGGAEGPQAEACPEEDPADLSRVHRPSAQRRYVRRISSTALPGGTNSVDFDNTEVLLTLAAGPLLIESEEPEDIGATMFSHLSCAYSHAKASTVNALVCQEIAQLKERGLRGLSKRLTQAGASERAFTHELLMFAIQSDEELAFRVLKSIKFVLEAVQAGPAQS
eukprot:GGOE01021450.1.p1 GENE.GGOE01021450.1~~GGOE01021450.1.p1  ORF type:complete len:1044 (+),score=259.28 GGOE01021450.1:341-3472(+)